MSLEILHYTEILPNSLALNKYISEMQNHQILDKNIHSISATLQLKCQT